MEIKKGRDLSPPMQLQIQIPIQITIDVPENKKIPIQGLTSVIYGGLLLSAYKKGEIAKRMKNKMSWGVRGVRSKEPLICC